MKKIVLFIYLSLYFSALSAQNLVSNYSFEVYDTCPRTINNGTYEYSLGIPAWGQATMGTPDYFNVCDTEAAYIGRIHPILGVPYNFHGKQTAYEGNAYTGIVLYLLTSDYKEYLITNIPALEVDTTYRVSIKVSLADSCKYACDAMGVFFTTYGTPDQSSVTTLYETPQIDYTGYGVISDTTNWTTLTGVFTADSAYTTLIIGGFKPRSSMNIVLYNTSPSYAVAYYYIDNVVVEKLSTTSAANIGPVSNVNSAQIYPSPSAGIFNVTINSGITETVKIIITNALGEKVKEEMAYTNERMVISLEQPGGVYYLTATSAHSTINKVINIVK